jgi:hypothetical protein
VKLLQLKTILPFLSAKTTFNQNFSKFLKFYETISKLTQLVSFYDHFYLFEELSGFMSISMEDFASFFSYLNGRTFKSITLSEGSVLGTSNFNPTGSFKLKTLSLTTMQLPIGNELFLDSIN